ncbi:MAG TPA: universal stress protein [Gemmatimonadales bacterium]|nr:universal stress protein [Gemmatimonadales bacterium]
MGGQPIVVGMDGSLESGAAARAGWLLAQAAGVECRLVHATRDVRTALEMAGTGISLDALELAHLAHARQEILTAHRSAIPEAAADELIVRPGPAAAVLDQVIAETEAQMLVLGGKHHSALGRWFGGSTVQHVVRRLDVPLLVTKGELRPRPRVLVAVDISYAASPTIERATAFARLLQGPLRALHAIEPAATVPEVLSLPNPIDFEGWSRERMERDVWPLLPIPDHDKVIRRGDPAQTIVEEAAAWRADVIVVGSHGKGWVDRLLIGSVTEDLLSDLPTAVLVIPVPAPAQRMPVPAGWRTAVAHA